MQNAKINHILTHSHFYLHQSKKVEPREATKHVNWVFFRMCNNPNLPLTATFTDFPKPIIVLKGKSTLVVLPSLEMTETYAEWPPFGNSCSLG